MESNRSAHGMRVENCGWRVDELTMVEAPYYATVAFPWCGKEEEYGCGWDWSIRNLSDNQWIAGRSHAGSMEQCKAAAEKWLAEAKAEREVP